MKWFLCFLMIGILSPLPVFAVYPLDSEPLAALLAEAAIHNPSLLAAREQVEVATSRIDQVSALPDPQLGFSLNSYPTDNLRSDATAMTGNDFRLSQSFPFPGKLATKKELAHQQVLWTQAKYDDLTLQVRQQVRDSWFQLSFQRKAINLTQTHIDLMDDLSRLVENRYQVGTGLQQNVLTAQVARSRLFDMLLRLQKDAEISQARINSLVGRETASPLAEIPEAETAVAAPGLAQLQQQAREYRPMFAAFNALIGQGEQKTRLAELDYRPDFNLWAGYRFRDDNLADGGTDFFSAGITINLPFPVAKRRAAVKEADAELRMAHQQYNDFSRQVDFELHRGLTELQQAQKMVSLYADGIVPQAEQAYKATLVAYQVDKVDFLVLHDAVMTLYSYRVDLARAQSDVQRSAARLQATAGLDHSRPENPTPMKKEAPDA